MNFDELIDTLHRAGCSCAICRDGHLTLCHQRGVADLLRLLTDGNETLRGAEIADKVIGKGAAALMILGGASRVWGDIISRPALTLLEGAGVRVSYGRLVDNIINRNKTGICPVESLCLEAPTAADCLPLIQSFVDGNRYKKEGRAGS